VNIKGGQTNLETTTLNLNTTGTGNTLIGTSGGSNSITFNRPLTPAYTYPTPSGSPTITTGAGAGKIGEVRYNTTVVTPILNGTVGVVICAITLNNTGVYMITVNAQMNNTVPILGTYFRLVVSGTTDPMYYGRNIGSTNILTAPSSYFNGISNTWIVQPAGAGTYSLIVEGITAGTNVEYLQMTSVRIA
jgi:hypothetical protein